MKSLRLINLSSLVNLMIAASLINSPLLSDFKHSIKAFDNISVANFLACKLISPMASWLVAICTSASMAIFCFFSIE